LSLTCDLAHSPRLAKRRREKFLAIILGALSERRDNARAITTITSPANIHL